MKNYPYISGQLFFEAALENINYFFLNSILQHEIRHSSHFEKGTYLRLSLNSDTELTFENIDNNEFLISGEANSNENLVKLAEITSSIFTKQKLRHRLELYNADDNEFGYYNYDWPK